MGMTREQARTYVETQLRPIVDRCGHAVQGVFDPDTGAQWAYTVGLNPELVITGMGAQLVVHVINDIVANLAGFDRDAEPGVYDDLLAGGYKLAIREVRLDDAVHPLTFAWELRDGGRDFRAMQLVWPDNEHRFPWEPDYDAAKFPQPLLPEA